MLTICVQSKASQCVNKSELELEYAYLEPSVEHTMSFSMLIMNMKYACYAMNDDILPIALYL